LSEEFGQTWKEKLGIEVFPSSGQPLPLRLFQIRS